MVTQVDATPSVMPDKSRCLSWLSNRLDRFGWIFVQSIGHLFKPTMIGSFVVGPGGYREVIGYVAASWSARSTEAMDGGTVTSGSMGGRIYS